ncbi:rhodanese-like domain-containing protein 6 [Zingiber officinale]|uniref:rhodanese-like domain-containing protein 6 n=1 Tax=Zingiber officinale TaxID=94328 RepID=UPI001C4B5448|nr:rhodanese-like domain-containing protein 6 [Zingiber officinale]
MQCGVLGSCVGGFLAAAIVASSSLSFSSPEPRSSFAFFPLFSSHHRHPPPASPPPLLLLLSPATNTAAGHMSSSRRRHRTNTSTSLLPFSSPRHHRPRVAQRHYPPLSPLLSPEPPPSSPPSSLSAHQQPSLLSPANAAVDAFVSQLLPPPHDGCSPCEYKYAPVPNIVFLLRFFDSNCQSLALLGCARIAPYGVNVTVGGKMPSLEKHIAALKSMSLFDAMDGKLHEIGNRDSMNMTVNYRRCCSSIDGTTLIPGTNMDSKVDKQLVLLDARNLYETQIGKFKATNAETLDQELRQYSDLASWIFHHSEKLHDKCILMYCTGGIRCETASAYIRSKGVGFENVFQLFDGIQKYLEQFPAGGYFRGKNFVFDHRISVGSKDTDVIGSCVLCGISFDDYSSRCRCHYYRMLVLVCYDCQVVLCSFQYHDHIFLAKLYFYCCLHLN